MRNETEEKIELFISNSSFYKIYSRNTSVYTIEVFGHASKKYLEKLYGITWSEVAINTNEFCAAYGLGDERDIVFKKIVERINHSNSIKDFYENLALPDYEAYISLTDQLRQKYTNNTRIDFAELKKDFNDFHEAFYKLIAQCYIIFISDDPLTRELETTLQSSFPDDTQQESTIKKQVVSVPLRKTAVVKERIDFLKLKLAENNPDFLDLLADHTEQYNWFPVYNASDDVYTSNHYREELGKLTVESAQNELDRILKEQTEHEQQYALFLETISDKHLRKVVSLVNDFSYYREHRNDIRRKGLRNAQGLFDAIAKSLSITRKEVCYMNTAEINACLSEVRLVVPTEKIRSRMQSFVELFDGESDIIDDPVTVEKCRNMVAKKVSKDTTLRGAIGSKGRAVGTAFVIDNIQKLNDIKEGSVLVTSMTGPDYVPAMRKAVAIVTDEGGITCHAAIIARELRKPCVIGTKFATQVLKDGDLVEVDADNGIVNILTD